MKQSQRIVKNALSGVAAEAVGGFLQLVVILIIARSVGVKDFGTFSFILALSGVFRMLADFGLTNILVREMATRRAELPALLGAARGLLWALSIAAGALMALVVFFLPLTFDLKLLTLVMGIATLTLFHSAGYQAVFRATEEMEFNAAGYVLHKIFLLGLVYAVLLAGFGLWGVVVAHAVSNLLLWLFYHLVVSIRHFRPRISWNIPVWKELIREALPLGGGMVIRQTAWQIDILLLTWLSGMVEVGLFSAPYRIVMAVRLLPLVLALPLFPVFARLGQESVPRFRTAYERGFKFFCLISFPLSAVFVVMAGSMTNRLLGPEYLQAASVFRILGVAMVPIFASALFPYLFTSLGQQRLFLMTALVGFALRVVLNVALIPRYGYTGSCIAIVASEVVVLIIGLYGLAQAGVSIRVLPILWRPLLAAGLMGIPLYLTTGLSLMAELGGLALSSILYFGILWAIRTFTHEDVLLAREGLAFLRPYLNMLQGKQATD